MKKINVSMSPQPSLFLPIHPVNLKYQLEKPGSLIGQSGWPQNLVKVITEQSFLDKLIAAVGKVEKLGPVQAKKEESKEKQEQQQKKEEKTEKNAFNVVLKSINAENKIKVIKEVKTMTGWGLKECKDKIEALDKSPLVLGQNVPKEKAQKWLDTLKELQSVVELQ